jgi:FdrA protein
MSAVIINQVRKGLYLDSVALMRFSRTIAALEDVQEAALMMGTPSNRQIMADAGLLDPSGEAAGGGDLIVAIRANNNSSAEHAAQEALALLDQPRAVGAGGNAWRPRTSRAAINQLPGANLALISVPGDFAIAEARKAVRRGLHAMIFSDNVPLDEEVALKREARELGRLVMGPDCGTAIIGGIPLAFANRVRRGDVGIVGASGTGTQEVSCLITRHGGGISHAIGVGGRDLSDAVGGISTLMALEALANDSATKHVVLISKPPSSGVTAKILEKAAGIGKPVTVCFLGADVQPMPVNATQVFSLKDAALNAVDGAVDGPMEEAMPTPEFRAGEGRAEIRGLFSGGTLCAEAQAILLGAGVAVASNAAIPGASSVVDTDLGHLLLDLGDDAYTKGRPHPMIDPMVRDEPIAVALSDATVAVILVDIVIGLGAHGDPAGHLARSLERDKPANGPEVIASVTGTEADPQVRSFQIAKLQAAGIHVAPTNADAAAWALEVVRSSQVV